MFLFGRTPATCKIMQHSWLCFCSIFFGFRGTLKRPPFKKCCCSNSLLRFCQSPSSHKFKIQLPHKKFSLHLVIQQVFPLTKVLKFEGCYSCILTPINIIILLTRLDHFIKLNKFAWLHFRHILNWFEMSCKSKFPNQSIYDRTFQVENVETNLTTKNLLSAKTVLDRAIITINNYVVLLSKGASLVDIREKCLQHCLESFNETFTFNSVGVSCNKLK